MSELWQAPAHRMLEWLNSGEVTSLQLVEACLGRIREVNTELNAVVVIDEDAVRDAARRSDAARAQRLPQGKLAGLPYTAKLDYDVEGQATSEGTTILRDAIAPRDSPMIRRMRRAGAVLLGRTNEPDFGIVYHTNSTLYGLTRNPWNRDRSAGGSSGGEGSAVASGMSPLGLGSDIGGSIRGPASFNGVVGFKPGLGRYPSYTAQEPNRPIHEQLFTARGPLARSVHDIMVADEVLQGVDPADPWTSPVDVGTGRPRRIGVVYAPTGTAVPDGITTAIREAARALQSDGYSVIETQIDDWDQYLGTYVDIMLTGFGGDQARWNELHPETQFFLGHVHRRRGEHGGTGEPLGAALASRNRLGVQFNNFHSQFDALMMPTWADQPFRIDELATTAGIDTTTLPSRHLYFFNLLGVPALSMPVGIVDGMPVGVHISSTRHRDQAVIAVAADLERAIGTFTPINP